MFFVHQSPRCSMLNNYYFQQLTENSSHNQPQIPCNKDYNKSTCLVNLLRKEGHRSENTQLPKADSGFSPQIWYHEGRNW